jgi:hypothetical protein
MSAGSSGAITLNDEARAEPERRRGQRLAAVREPFVQRAEHGDEEGRYCTDDDAVSHAGRPAADDERDAGQHGQPKQEIARREPRPREPRFDERREGRRERERRCYRRVRELDRTVERQPMQYQTADARVRQPQPRGSAQRAQHVGRYASAAMTISIRHHTR